MRVPYSSFNSKYYPWFVEMGYPQLDLRFVRENGQETGEWAIIEMHNSPVIPDLTKWQDVFTGFRNVEISRSRLKKLVESIDTKKKEIWDREEQKTKSIEAEQERWDKWKQESSARKADAFLKNPDWVERFMKNGAAELHPYSVYRNISRSKF